MKELEAPDEPILTYNIEDADKGDTSIKISGYADGSMDLTCFQEGDEVSELSFTPKGIAALKRALTLWETAMGKG